MRCDAPSGPNTFPNRARTFVVLLPLPPTMMLPSCALVTPGYDDDADDDNDDDDGEEDSPKKTDNPSSSKSHTNDLAVTS